MLVKGQPMVVFVPLCSLSSGEEGSGERFRRVRREGLWEIVVACDQRISGEGRPQVLGEDTRRGQMSGSPGFHPNVARLSEYLKTITCGFQGQGRSSSACGGGDPSAWCWLVKVGEEERSAAAILKQWQPLILPQWSGKASLLPLQQGGGVDLHRWSCGRCPVSWSPPLPLWSSWQGCVWQEPSHCCSCIP